MENKNSVNDFTRLVQLKRESVNWKIDQKIIYRLDRGETKWWIM